MFAQIVVLYMTFTLNLPTWCKALMFISISLDFIYFGIKLNKH